MPVQAPPDPFVIEDPFSADTTAIDVFDAELSVGIEGSVSADTERMRGRVLAELSVRYAAGPVLAAVGTGLLDHSPSAYVAALLTFVAFMAGGLAFPRRELRSANLLPLAGTLRLLAPAGFGLVALTLLVMALGIPSLEGWQLVAVTVLAGGPSLLTRRLGVRRRHLRTAVIGSASAATTLGQELELAGITRYRLVGNICLDESDQTSPRADNTLGPLSRLCELVEHHNIDLLVMAGEVSRLAVFDEIARSCLHLPVRLWELSGFYEDVFGHVPVAEINTSWFQYIMHPRYKTGEPVSKRVLDSLVAAVIGLLLWPLIGLLALLVRRDGGPALFKQVRIGEGGRPFTVYKLRTMREGSDEGHAQWAAADDPRVTRLGRWLRRTHLDELPQLINVLRGDMTLVGPRPEQPEFVERLEQTVPFYSRRHLIRPGITGWAQVRCGYAGSDLGSAWKLSHDLYYLKHRSTKLDLAIIAETLRTLVADRQYGVAPSGVSSIIRTESPDSLRPNAALVP